MANKKAEKTACKPAKKTASKLTKSQQIAFRLEAQRIEEDRFTVALYESLALVHFERAQDEDRDSIRAEHLAAGAAALSRAKRIEEGLPTLH